MTALVRYEMSSVEWIGLARKLFEPSPRSACVVCDRFPSLTQAHHVVPLSLQALGDRMQVINDHEWLCPTHHAAVHILIGQMVASATKASQACINVCSDLDIDELRKVMPLAERAMR